MEEKIEEILALVVDIQRILREREEREIVREENGKRFALAEWKMLAGQLEDNRGSTHN